MFKEMIETRILSENRPVVCKRTLCYKVFRNTHDKIKYFEEYNKKYL